METFLIIWFGFGALLAPFEYAGKFAYYQRKWPNIAEEQYKEDMSFSLSMAVLAFLFPPACLVTSLMRGTFTEGLKWK